MRRAIFGKRVMQITVFLLVGLMISGGFSSMISASPSYPVHPVDSNKRAVTVRTPSSEVNECDQSIKLKFSFSSPQIKHVGDYDEITMQELYNLNEPGMPVLPFKTVKILLPPNSSLKNISVIPENKITLDGFFNIKLGQKPVPIPYIQAKNISDNFGGMDAYPQSMNKTRVCTDIKNQQNQQHCKQDPYQIQSINSSTLSFNQTVFDSAEIFPPELYSMGGIYQFRGYQILLVNLNPAQYVAKTGTVSYFETMNMYITTDDWSSKNYNLPENFRSLPQDIDRVKDIVDNPSMIDTYNTFRNELSKSSYDYVIITNENLASSFQPLADWKNQKEVATTIVTVENITSNPDYWNTTNSLFNDTQAQIRSFIKYAYNNWGIEYVLLGGDDEIIPHRGLYVDVGIWWYGIPDDDIPADIYYGALDGNWNNDADSSWGEPGEEDLYAEVYVGRAPVNTATEALNFVNKIITYETNPSLDYYNNILMLAAKLDSETDSGITKDNISKEYIPITYNITKLYERNGTASVLNTTNLLNAGQHIVNHIGHANNHLLGLACIDIDYEEYYCESDVAALVNSPKYSMFYSVGCYANAFDNRDPYGDYIGDAISECFINNPDGGAFAFIGNSRYGWYEEGNASAYSGQFDTEFFKTLFVDNITNVGKTLQYSKENLVGYISSDNVMRWCYYTSNLLGDPETSIGNPVQQEHEISLFSVNISKVIEVNTTTFFNVTIMNRGTNDESNVTVEVHVDGLAVNYTFNLIQSNATANVSFYFISFVDRVIYNVTVYVYPVTGENIVYNNIKKSRLMVPGNWTVTNTQTFSNQTIQVIGNLTVGNGGNLTFDNVTLQMNLLEDGRWGIHVDSGGTLNIYNSNITPVDSDYRYKFEVYGNMDMWNCNITYAWGSTNDPFPGGIQIFSNNVTISNCNISYSGAYGIRCEGSSPSIINNNISLCNGGGIRCVSSSPVIDGNIIVSNGDITGGWSGIWCDASSKPVISNNMISDCYRGITLYGSSDVTIYNCTITDIKISQWFSYEAVGIFLYFADNNNITKCVSNNNHWGVYLYYSSNNRVSNSNMSYNIEGGIMGYESDYTNINKCSIYSGGDYGIHLSYTDNSNIINCNISRNIVWGISIYGSSNVSLSNNNVSFNGGRWPGTSHYYTFSDCINGINIHYWGEGIAIRGGSEVTITNSIITENCWTGIICVQSQTTIHDCIVTSNKGWGIRSIGEKLTAYDNSFSDNGEGGICQQWFLNVQIIKSDTTPLCHAPITIKNSLGIKEREGATNESGCFYTYLTEYIILNNGTTVNYTPHKFFVFAENAFSQNQTDVIIDCNKEMKIIVDIPSSQIGDWIIVNQITHSNEIVLLDGNVTISTGGNLTFDNVTLIMYCTENNIHAINVTANGNFYAYNSTIIPYNVTCPYNFVVYGNMSMQNCSVSYMNTRKDGGYIYEGGIQVYSDNVSIIGCRISHGGEEGWGIYCYNSSPTIDSSRIIGCRAGIYCQHSSSTITNTTIICTEEYEWWHSTPYRWGIACGYSSPTITNCTVTQYSSLRSKGIYLYQCSNTNIINCTSIGNPDGIILDTSYSNNLSNCKIQGGHTLFNGILLYCSSGNIISGCSISKFFAGVCFYYSNNNLIIDSCMSSNICYGTVLDTTSGNTFVNCEIAGNYIGVCSPYSNPTIINSTITKSLLYDFQLYRDAFPTVINTTFDENKVYFDEAWALPGTTASLTVKWYLDVKIVENTSAPLSNATVAITDLPEKGALFKDSFEGDKGWTLNNSDVWERGIPTTGPCNAHNGSKVWATNLSGNYKNYEDDWLISPTISIPSNATSAELTFWHWYNTEYFYDNGYVKVRDETNSSWETLATYNGSSWGWRNEKISINKYIGHNISIGFHFKSDYYTTYDGWYIDDVKIKVFKSNGEFDIETTAEIYNGTTDINGWIKDIVCTERVQNPTSNITYAPHNITVSKEKYFTNYTSITMNKSKEITIVLERQPNKPPVIQSYLPETNPTIIETESITFNITAYDPDTDDTITIQWYLNGALVATGDSYTFMSDYESAGIYTVNVTVSDGEYNVSHSWTLTVNNVNRPPVIETYSPATDPTITEEENQTFTITASDPDTYDILIISWYLNDTLVLMPVGTAASYTFVANYTSAGWYEIKVVVSDGYLSTKHSWILTVTNVNRAPSIDLYSPLTNPTITEEQSQLFTVSASDPDGESLTIEWYLNNSLIATGSSYTFTANYTSAGWYSVKVVVSDGELSTEHSWILTVTNVNRAPVIETIGDKIAYEGQVFSLQISATDMDGDILTFSDNTTLFNINPATGLISFTPNYDSAGVYFINITVTDGTDIVWQIFKLTIINVNRAPVINSTSPAPNPTINEGQSQTFSIDAYDPDGSIPEITWKLDDTIVGFDASYLFSANYTSSGQHVINVTVTDGEYFVYHQWILTVNDVDVIGPSGGNITHDIIKIVSPPNAVAQNVTLNITLTSATPPLGYGVVGAVYKIETTAVFTQPITLIFSYNESDLPENVSEDGLAIYKKTEEGWVKLDSKVDKINNTVSTTVIGFSDYAIFYQQPSAEAEEGKPSEIPWLYTLIPIVVITILAGAVAIILLAGAGIGVKRVRKQKTVTVRCPKCGETIEVTSAERPLSIVCPKCGVKGVLEE